MYFRVDGGNYQNALKILRGMHSNTFNYLEHNKEELLIGPYEMPIFYHARDKEHHAEKRKQKAPFPYSRTEINSVEFFSECVRYNRPCMIEGLAQHWPAFKKWKTEDKQTALEAKESYLIHMIGAEKQVTVYR